MDGIRQFKFQKHGRSFRSNDLKTTASLALVEDRFLVPFQQPLVIGAEQSIALGAEDTIAVFLFVLPAIVAGASGFISTATTLVLAIVGCTVLPVLLYRSTWSWWLMLYFLFLPNSLPANGGPTGAAEED